MDCSINRQRVLSLLGILLVSLTSNAWSQPNAKVVSFAIQQTQPQDTAHQQIQCSLDAERTIRQQNQLVDTSKQTLLRKQDRTLTILAVDNGMPTRAKLVYGDSSTHVRGEDNQAVKATQPVAGNTYYIAKSKGNLTITDDAGKPITEEEDKILQLHLQTFGKPNPLATFLNGQRIAIGQSIEVPDEVASELLGLTGNTGKTDKLILQLVGTKQMDRLRCAVFETLLRSSSEDTVMSLIMKGELVIETNTCRTRSIRLHGPVAISETRGPAVGRFVVSTNGSLQVAVQTSYGQGLLSSRGNAIRR